MCFKIILFSHMVVNILWAYKQFILLNNNKKKKKPKWVEDISPKKKFRWPISTWKDVQHCKLLDKCKSKLQ